VFKLRMFVSEMIKNVVDAFEAKRGGQKRKGGEVSPSSNEKRAKSGQGVPNSPKASTSTAQPADTSSSNVMNLKDLVSLFIMKFEGL
jgi:hypothetical protein